MNAFRVRGSIFFIKLFVELNKVVILPSRKKEHSSLKKDPVVQLVEYRPVTAEVAQFESRPIATII